jgi:ribosomal protein S18 acetylase RimI-like enzyme
VSPPAGPLLRRARFEDWPGIARLLRDIDELHAGLAPQYFRSAPRAEVDWQRVLADPTAAVFVAAGGSGAAGGSATGLLGLLSIRVYDTPADPTMVPRRRGHIETLVVETCHRRRGIGRRLLEQAADWARAQGAVELVLTTWTGNQAADAFYERLGYRVLSRVLHAPL